MAAPDFTLIRGGQVNQSGDARALFLKQYGGEVFTVFDRESVFMPRHYVRTISGGKSAQFPVVGGKTAAYHTPGTMIVGNAANLNEIVLTVDAFLMASSSIADEDQAISHFDYRQPFSTEDGKAIARQMDENVARCGILAALTTSSRLAAGDPYVDKTVGKVINQASSNTDVVALKTAMLLAATNFDEKDIPDSDRNMFLRPAQYQLLAADKDIISSDYGSASNIKSLRVPQLYSFNLIKTNALPNTNVTGTYSNKYNVDARNAVALIMRPRAVGTVKVRDLAVSMTGEEYRVTHNATLVKSQVFVGHGVLLPEEACLIRTAAPV
jgi:hypothetical protein